jgi:hypothetical protein
MGILEQIPDSILAQLPSYSPPPGVKPNFQSQVTRGTTFIIVGGIMLPIMMLFLGIRITSKIKIMGRYTWDDCKLWHSSHLPHWVSELTGL